MQNRTETLYLTLPDLCRVVLKKHIMDIMTIKVKMKMKMIEIPLVTTPMMTLVELAVCIEIFDQTSKRNLVTHTYMLVKDLW